MAMVTAAMLASTATVLAQETATATEEATGTVEALIWDDLRSPDGQYTDADLIDGITVNLYHLENVVQLPDDATEYVVKDVEPGKTGKWNGDWVYVNSKVSGVGGYVLGEDFVFPYMHGWVGWNDLKLDSQWGYTFYKLELADKNTFKPLDGKERIVQLTPWNLHEVKFFPATFSYLPPFEIKSTTAAISGYVWSDANANLEMQFNEKALSDWTIVLTNKYGSKIATAKSNIYGYYYFQGLKPGTYKVWVMGQRTFKQVAPYYNMCTWPPYGCEKGSHTISAVAGKYYDNKNFGMLDMRDSIWATLYYGLWWIGLLQYQFAR